MDAYNKLIEFLKSNEGRTMNVGIHASSVATFSTLKDWNLIDNGMDIIIEDNNSSIDIYLDGIDEVNTAKHRMHVYPEIGDFEIYTPSTTIGFEIVK